MYGAKIENLKNMNIALLLVKLRTESPEHPLVYIILGQTRLRITFPDRSPIIRRNSEVGRHFDYYVVRLK